ncbi:MAG: futalosine hydrolase [Bacteroidales bacterium]|nr:futalosine hydrolase [Bacteroidales bacterium]
MNILIVSATAKENGLATGLDVKKGIPIRVKEPFNHDVDVLVTGVGAVPTTFFLTKVVENYQLVINIGIAGSYNPIYSIGSVVCINEDTFGDYGIDDRGVFKSLCDVNINAKDEFPFLGDTLNNPWLKNALFEIKLPLVKGVTLSTASGSEEIIRKIKERWNADVETMESASVFYVCRLMDIKFVCLRSISNMVEPRDRSKWDFKNSINNLTHEVRRLINSITSDC